MPQNNSYDDFGKYLGTVVALPFETSISRRSLTRDFLTENGLNLTDRAYHRNSKLEKAILKTTYDNETKAKMFFIARVPITNIVFLNWLINSGIAKFNKTKLIVQLTTKENGRTVKRIVHQIKKHTKRRGPTSGVARNSRPSTSMGQKRGRGRPPKKTQRAHTANSTPSPMFHSSVHDFLIETAHTATNPISKSILYEKFKYLDGSRSKEVFDMVCKSVVQAVLESDENIVIKAKLCFMIGEKVTEDLETQLETHGDLELNEQRHVIQFRSRDGGVVLEINLKNRRRTVTEEPIEEEEEDAEDMNDTNHNDMPVDNVDVPAIDHIEPPAPVTPRAVKIEEPTDSEEGYDRRLNNRTGQRKRTAAEEANSELIPSTSTVLKIPKVEDLSLSGLKVPKVEEPTTTVLRVPKVEDTEDSMEVSNNITNNGSNKKSIPSTSTTGLKVPKMEEREMMET